MVFSPYGGSESGKHFGVPFFTIQQDNLAHNPNDFQLELCIHENSDENGLLRAPLFLLSMDMNSHEIDYELIGDDMQIVEIELDPGETVIAEAGAMNYMEDGIAFEAKMGDGSQPNQGLFGKLLDVGKRARPVSRFL